MRFVTRWLRNLVLPAVGALALLRPDAAAAVPQFFPFSNGDQEPWAWVDCPNGVCEYDPMLCGKDEAMVGVLSDTGSWVNKLIPVCAEVDAGGHWVGGITFPFACPGCTLTRCLPDEAVVRIYGRQGDFLDGLQLDCAPLDDQQGVSGSPDSTGDWIGEYGWPASKYFDHQCPEERPAKGIVVKWKWNAWSWRDEVGAVSLGCDYVYPHFPLETTAEYGDRFGEAFASGDFDGDGLEDLAVGVPGENGFGAVHVLYATDRVQRGDDVTGREGGLGGRDNRLISRDSLGLSGAVRGDLFGAALASGDLDNDGLDDLVVGSPGRDVSGQPNAGEVIVIHGTMYQGLADTGEPLVQGGVLGERPEANDEFGKSLAVGDFDCSGVADLAIGVPGEGLSTSLSGVGAVHVRYDRRSVPPGFFHQNTNLVEGDADKDDHFGTALAAADFNGGGCEDLAIGVPDEDFDVPVALENAGGVNVIYGSSAGLTPSPVSGTPADQFWNQGNVGADPAEAEDRFGASLAALEKSGSRASLAVGAPNETIDGFVNAGAVIVIHPKEGGLSSVNSQFIHQNTPGVDDGVEAQDLFGSALVAADFSGDNMPDLAVGVPGESVSGKGGAGAVNVLWSRLNSSYVYQLVGSTGGIPGLIVHQDKPGIAGGAEAYDYLGSSLGSGDFDGDGRQDLVIGVPAENIGDGQTAVDAGMLHVLYGQYWNDLGGPLSGSNSQTWQQNN